MDSSPAIDARHIALHQTAEAQEVFVVRGSPPVGLPLLVVRVLSLLDGERPLRKVFREAGITQTKGRAVVRKLKTLRIIERVEPLTRPRHFTELEEEFFASEVEPIDECDLPRPNLGERMRALIDRLRR